MAAVPLEHKEAEACGSPFGRPKSSVAGPMSGCLGCLTLRFDVAKIPQRHVKHGPTLNFTFRATQAGIMQFGSIKESNHKSRIMGNAAGYNATVQSIQNKRHPKA